MGILVAAAIATVTSLLVIGGLIAWRSPAGDKRVLILLILVQLPVSPLTTYGLRLPLEGLLEFWGVDAGSRRLFALFSRPVIEELMKLLPILFLWKSTTAETRLWRALAIGLGFGIGELWMLTENVYRTDPVTANLDLLTLTGFINERVMVCLIHGAQTAVALHQYGMGILIAIGLHTVGNLPFYLREILAFGFSEQTWTLILRSWVVWYTLVMGSIVWLMSGGDFHVVWLLFGDATCPFCGMVYPRAKLTWNLTVIHHDHCPRCKARNVF